MTVATGHSEDLDSADAIAEALDACADALGGRTPGAGLLYAGIDHDHQALLDGVEARYPGLPLVGCTTHGELSSGGFAEDSVALMLLHGEGLRAGAGVGEGARADPGGAARRAAAHALDGLGAPVRLAVLLPEGLGVPTDALLDALSAEVGPDVPVCGGLAADQARFAGTVQFCNGRAYTDAAPVLLLAGPLRVATGVASGWEPVGASLSTRVEGLAVREVDGRPPRDVWMDTFGSFDTTGGRNACAVYPGAAAGDVRGEPFYLATPSHFEDDGSMVMLNPVVPGARIRFVTATRDQILDGAAASAARARAAYGDAAPEAALVFSCAGRHLVLGTRVGKELRLLREHVGADVPVAGFYSNGEICPLPGAARPYTHGGTFVTVLIGEEAS